MYTQTQFYCFCSDANYQTILDKQIADPLIFSKFLNEYTQCTQGCGSCIEHLRDMLQETGQLFE